MDFEAYRVPASARVGVEIVLPNAPGAPFRVRLPTRYNREYSAAVQRALAVRMGPDGTPDFSSVDFTAWQEARLDAFLEFCVAAVPEGITREMLAGEYRPGLAALFELAEELADAEEAEAIETAKKS